MVNLNPQETNICLEFLRRTDLKGAEVNAFVKLVRKLEGKDMPVPEGKVEEVKKEIEEKEIPPAKN